MARLIYVPGPGARLVRGPVRTVPARLPSIEVPFFNTAGSVERGFDLMLDGARFVSLEESSAQGGAHTAEIRVVLNWFGDLKK